MADPGKMANHQALILFLDKLNMLPQVTSLGDTPIPRNDRNASIRIAAAIPKAIVISTGVNELGIACRNNILVSLKPIACAASM